MNLVAERNDDLIDSTEDCEVGYRNGKRTLTFLVAKRISLFHKHRKVGYRQEW
jgi:hypothetical protein